MTEPADLDALNAEVLRLYHAGNYAAATPIAQRALHLAVNRFGSDDAHVGTSLNSLAALFQAQGQHANAELLLKRALLIWETALGPDHADVATALNNLAQVLQEQGRFDEAEAHFKRALAILEEVQNTDPYLIGAALNNLALVYKDQGRFIDAEPLYNRTIAIFQGAFGSDHASVGTALDNLAELCRLQGRYIDAEPLYKRALAIYERVIGPDHPDVGTTLSNLGLLYNQQGRYADAEPLYKRALAIRERSLGPDHPHVGLSLNNLAALYQAQSRYAEAEPLYVRSLSIWERALGPDHPEVGRGLTNFGFLYRVQGRYAEAEPLYKRALAIRERALGPDHPDVAHSLNNLAALYLTQERYGDAELPLKRSISIYEKTLGPDSPEIAPSLNNLAGVYWEQGRHAEAEPLYKRTISIMEKALGPDHPGIATALNNLAQVCREQGRHAEAEALFRREDEMPGWEVIDIPILFATNRDFEIASGRTTFIAKQKTNLKEISFGKGIVRAPKSEVLNRADRLAQALGQLHRATGRQTSAGGLALRGIERDEGGAGFEAIARDRLSRAARFPGQAFIFVHGYNNSFEDAVRRTAMIAFDLDFDGATFLFTWPSQKKLSGYRTDRKRARVAAPFLLALIEKIGTELPEVKLHLLAHSTGGEIVLSALSELAAKDRRGPRLNLGELILAHADVDPARLARVIPSIKMLGVGVTSYSSAADWAMRFSQFIRFKQARAGYRPVNISGVDAIDITGLSGGPLLLNHTVFVDNPMVFGDMARLMATGERPPDKRTALFAPVTTQRGTHWQYKRATRD